ncbi:MAG: hypothetical protein ABUS79_14030, partial [Pseudomonadota bacterium]
MSDMTGSSDALVSILNPPGRGIGTLSNVSVGAAKNTNPFCNSSDANASPATVSFAGSSDYQDLDPVRTNCVAGKDGVCEPYRNFSPYTTGSAFAGDLGVVLPIVLPDSTSTTPSDIYPSLACSTACMLVGTIRTNQIPANFRCPGGALPLGGFCFMPFAGSAAAPDPRCYTPNTTRCVDIAAREDGRQYNLTVVVAASQVPAAQRGTAQFQFAIDANKRIENGAFFRIHANAAGANNVPDPSVGQSGICRQYDATAQIGCLVDSDPCSVGFAGREAAHSFPGLGTPAIPQLEPLKALAINGTPPFTPSSDPDLAIKNLLAAPGTLPLYPFARRLYLSTIYGFGNLPLVQSELAACMGNNAIIGPALSSSGYVPVPGGVQCLDYPEEMSIVPTPPANVQGAGNVAFVGCGSGLSGQNACLASPPTISN